MTLTLTTEQMIQSLSSPSSLPDSILRARIKTATQHLHHIRKEYNSIKYSCQKPPQPPTPSPQPKSPPHTSSSRSPTSPIQPKSAPTWKHPASKSPSTASTTATSFITPSPKQLIPRRHDNLQIDMTAQAWQPLSGKRERKPRVRFGEALSRTQNKGGSAGTGKDSIGRIEGGKRKRSSPPDESPATSKRPRRSESKVNARTGMEVVAAS